MPTTFHARWVVPVAGPPIEGGSVTVDGERIVAVEAEAKGEDLGEVAVLPGLVNAHAHLDLSGMAGVARPSRDFTGWLGRVIAHRRSRPAGQVGEDIRAGIVQSLRAGTTLVGDISGDGASWELLERSPLRAVVFREVMGLTPQRATAAVEAVLQWKDRPRGRCLPGISPHAPYSCHAGIFMAARRSGLPVCTHLAESPEELELLARLSGPFVDFLQGLGVWHPEGLLASPAKAIEALGKEAPVLLAHGNYLGDEALPGNVSVVYCPRTHAAFGHPPHPAPRLVAAGHRVALGTDGLSSNPDLSLLEEMRFLHRKSILPPEAIIRAGTLSGAEALGQGRECGSLQPGKRADLVVVPLGAGKGAHVQALAGRGPPARVMAGGLWVDFAGADA